MNYLEGEIKWDDPHAASDDEDGDDYYDNSQQLRQDAGLGSEEEEMSQEESYDEDFEELLLAVRKEIKQENIHIPSERGLNSEARNGILAQPFYACIV